MSTPDIIIRLSDDGRIAEILSTLPIKIQTIEENPIEGGQKYVFNEVACQDVLGTHSELLAYLGSKEPIREFNAIFMFAACCEAPILRSAVKKAGYGVDFGTLKDLKNGENKLTAPFIKALQTIFNAFVVADPKLMDLYLKVQK